MKCAHNINILCYINLNIRKVLDGEEIIKKMEMKESEKMLKEDNNSLINARKDLVNEKQRRLTIDETNIFAGCLIGDHLKERGAFVRLANEFRKSNSYEEKRKILSEIAEVRGRVPVELEMELNEMQKGQRR